MQLFKDVDECISAIDKTISKYSCLSQIINSSDHKKWKERLIKDGDACIVGEDITLNLLNISALVGLPDKQVEYSPIYTACESMLRKVDKYIQMFPELIPNDSFKRKIKNIDDIDFLATMSELSIAAELKAGGFMIDFEKKFKHQITNKNRDFDVTASKNGHTYNLDVYMPHHQTDERGFFDPKHGDTAHVRKVSKKLDKKFGVNGIENLAGKAFLAVNIAFDDGKLISLFQASASYQGISLPKDVDGIIVFKDDFASDSSFLFLGIYQ